MVASRSRVLSVSHSALRSVGFMLVLFKFAGWLPGGNRAARFCLCLELESADSPSFSWIGPHQATYPALNH